MKKITFFFILSVLLSCQNKQGQADNLKRTQLIVKQIQQKLLPDKRDGILDIQLEKHQDTIVLNGATNLPKIKKTIIKALKNNKIAFNDRIKLLPDEKFKNQVGITRLSVANLRVLPKHSAELVTQTLMGMPVKIFEEKNGFYHVKTPEGYYAWVDAAGIIILNKTFNENWLQKPKIIITASYGKSRREPYTDALPVSDYVLNDVFVLIEKKDNYTLVEYPDGRQAFINNEDYMRLSDFKALIQQATTTDLITEAKQYLGIPYLWGGTSVKALDCSGFTKNLFAQFGYLLPRDASQQAKIGKPVTITDDFKNLQPGDLLFFGTKKNGHDRITHVALHLGQGRIIHATGEVKIESLNPADKNFNPDRRKTLLQARRVFGVYPKKFTTFY